MTDASPKLFIAAAICLALAVCEVIGFAALCGQAVKAERTATAQDWADVTVTSEK